MRPAQSRNRAFVDSLLSVQFKEVGIRRILLCPEFSTLNKGTEEPQDGFCKSFRSLGIEVTSQSIGQDSHCKDLSVSWKRL